MPVLLNRGIEAEKPRSLLSVENRRSCLGNSEISLIRNWIGSGGVFEFYSLSLRAKRSGTRQSPKCTRGDCFAVPAGRQVVPPRKDTRNRTGETKNEENKKCYWIVCEIGKTISSQLQSGQREQG
jgi:hypothetical protein